MTEKNHQLDTVVPILLENELLCRLVTCYCLSSLGSSSVDLRHKEIVVLWFDSYEGVFSLKDQVGSYTVHVPVEWVFSSDVVSMIH